MEEWKEQRKKALHNRAIRRWVEHPRNKPTQAPLTMKGEPYYKRGIRHKLHIGQPLLQTLQEENILALTTKGRNHYRDHPYAVQKTLADVVSIGWNVDPLSVLLENAERPKGTTIPQHVTHLCKAYEGTFWFDNLRRHYTRNVQNGRRPCVREWQVIPRSSLDNWLCIDNQYRGKMLCEKGLIVRQDGEPFTPRSSDSIIHNEGFAALLAYLEQAPQEKIFLPAQQDKWYVELITNLVKQQVIPRLIKARLHPGLNYSCAHARMLTGVSSNTFKHARLEGQLPYMETRNPQEPSVKGIDIVLYSMRPKTHYSAPRATIAKTFGLAESEVDKLHLPHSRQGTIGHQQAVLPLWKRVRDSLRETMYNTSGALHTGKTFFVTWTNEATRAYRCELDELSLACGRGKVETS